MAWWIERQRETRFQQQGELIMDLEGFCFGAFIGEEEKRKAQKKAEEEKKKLKAEYDQWCKDHGIPPPPDKKD